MVSLRENDLKWAVNTSWILIEVRLSGHACLRILSKRHTTNTRPSLCDIAQSYIPQPEKKAIYREIIIFGDCSYKYHLRNYND